MLLNSVIPTETSPNGHGPKHQGNSAPRPIDELNQQGRRIQELLEQAEAMPDPAARALIQECVQSVLAFHGQGLAQMLQVVRLAGSDGQKVFEQLIQDSVVRGLLLIHGLHPVDLKTRLHDALNKVRPYMESHGGNVELISLENDVARLRLQGTCKSCPSSAVTLELAVRQAIEEACPDLMGFEVEGAAESTAPGKTPAPTWTILEGLGQLGNGEIKATAVADIPLIICKMNENVYAYRNICPACGLSFQPGSLEDGQIKCPLGHRYDAQRAGGGVDNAALHLDPFPLLVEKGEVKISVR